MSGAAIEVSVEFDFNPSPKRPPTTMFSMSLAELP
jgi:hypothetical protein